MSPLLVDSNIVIYACSPVDTVARSFLQRYRLKVSDVTRIETLGYHKLEPLQRELLRAFFDSCERLTIHAAVVDRAIQLRQAVKLPLADAMIAATALVEQLPLCTRNVADFRHVQELQIVNPYDNA